MPPNFAMERGSRDYEAHKEDTMDLEAAMKNPGATFGTPEVLEATKGLSTEQKCAILTQWKDQLQQLQTADDENMPGPEAPHGGTAELLKRVATVLGRLDSKRAG
jgi:hypothetical protein